MTADAARAHWEKAYASKPFDAMSWFQSHDEASIALIRSAGVAKHAAILDVGGGASTLAGDLLALGYTGVSVLDVSARAIETAKEGLGTAAALIRWIVADLLEAELGPSAYDLWHDRALLHFMTSESDRQRYTHQLITALRPGGHAVIATFGPAGPLSCSGLPTERYDAARLAAVLGADFELRESSLQLHRTPSNAGQQFVYTLFRKR